MKLNKLLILFTLITAVFSASVSAQQDTAKPSKEKKEKKANKTEVKKEKSDREYMLGAKGGCYYLTSSGKKSYVDKKFCEGLNQTADPMATTERKTATGTETEEPKTASGTKPEATETTETTQPPETAKTPQSTETTENKNGGAKAAAPNKANVTNNIKTTGTEPAGKTTSNGRTYIKGPRGGCYYLTDSGKKVYVSDKSLCGN